MARVFKNILRGVQSRAMLFGIWVAKAIPYFFKPLKFWLADRMILACGFQDKNGDMVIIYRPAFKTRNHELRVSRKFGWRSNGVKRGVMAARPMLNGFMREIRLRPRGDKNFFIRGKRGWRHVSSKVVEGRASTIFGRSNFQLERSHLRFSWQNSNDKSFWFSFLTIEDSGGNMVSGIYSKKDEWVFGEIDDLPYFTHDLSKSVLQMGREYLATLYQIDKYNWVTHIDEVHFRV